MNIKNEKIRKIWSKKALINEMNYANRKGVVYHRFIDYGKFTLNGSDEDAEEFAVQFSMLSGDAESLRNDIRDYDVEEYFDNFFVAVHGAEFCNGLSFFDECECDYYGLDSYETSIAEEESKNRLLHLKKSEIIDIAVRCFRVFMAFQSVYSRYQDLKVAIDILNDRHNGFVEMTKQINELYDKANEEHFFGQSTSRLNKIIANLPDFAWFV